MEGCAGQRYRAEVRPAHIEDSVGILQTLQEALAHAPDFYPAPELPYALQYIMDLIAQDLVRVLATPAGDIVGVLVLDWAHWPWNRQARYLYNQHLWVEPIWRGHRAAANLLAEAKTIAASNAVPLMIETSMLDADTGKKERFIEKNGFRPVGGKFFFTPNQSM